MKLVFRKLIRFIFSFWKRDSNKRALSGSSFLELAVAMAVLGVLASSSIQTETGIEDRNAELITEKRIKKIQDAMVVFLKNNKRLPCPSSLTDRYDSQLGAEEIYGTITNANMTINICSTSSVRNDLSTNARIIPSPEIYRSIIHKSTSEPPAAYGSFYANYPKIPPTYLIQGAVPTATLGLKPEDGLDGFGRKIFYSVHTILANNRTSNPNCMSSSAYGRVRRYCFEGAGNSETQFTAHANEMDYELSSTRYLPIFNLTFKYSNSTYGYAKGYPNRPNPYGHLDTAADVRAAYALVTTDKNGKGGVNKFGVRNGCPDLGADKVNIGGTKAGCTGLTFNNYTIESDVLYDIKVNNATANFSSVVNTSNQKFNTKVFPIDHIDLLIECNEGLNNGCQNIKYAYLKDDPEETGCFTRNDCPKNDCGENKVCRIYCKDKDDEIDEKFCLTVCPNRKVLKDDRTTYNCVPCKDDSDCDDDERCDPILSYCTTQPYTHLRQCYNDYYGTRMPSFCGSDSDLLCSKCENNSECPTGALCYRGYCTEVNVKLSPGACSVCNSWLTCSDSTCESAKCWHGNNCSTGEQCINGYCATSYDALHTNGRYFVDYCAEQCGDRSVCFSNRFPLYTYYSNEQRYRTYCNDTCSSNSDCESDEFCYKGWCYKDYAHTYSDTAPYHLQRAHHCRQHCTVKPASSACTSNCSLTTCNSDSDCPVRNVAVSGECTGSNTCRYRRPDADGSIPSGITSHNSYWAFGNTFIPGRSYCIYDNECLTLNFGASDSCYVGYCYNRYRYGSSGGDWMYSEVVGCEENCGSREYCGRFCTSCTSDSNCASNEWCNNGYCEEVSCLHECGSVSPLCNGTGCRFTDCTSNSQCNTGEICDYGYCVTWSWSYQTGRCRERCGYRTKGWDCASVCPPCRYENNLTPDTELLPYIKGYGEKRFTNDYYGVLGSANAITCFDKCGEITW